MIIIFGPGKLPEIGKTSGKTVKGFRDSMNNVTNEVREEISQIKDSISNSENNKNNKIM
ncbi:MAG: twin-arginine translocase TatA/TatE family subunit [Cyanobacteria bacterium]|nr:twin-arginine translocase TatA/TatE family subunit [Cyanobacteriota bacterium]